MLKSFLVQLATRAQWRAFVIYVIFLFVFAFSDVSAWLIIFRAVSEMLIMFRAVNE